MTEKNTRGVGLTFANYNHSFHNFYESYKNQCLTIAEKTLLSDVEDIRKIISTFIYEYDFAVLDKKQVRYYRTRLKEIKKEFVNDQEIKEIIKKDFAYMKNRLIHHKKYYFYFLKYLTLLGQFTMELTATYMPHTNIQKKLIRFSNNQIFFEKFNQHKQVVLENLSEFSLLKFSKSYNSIVTFYYGYYLFINNEDRIIIEKLLSSAISIYLSYENIKLLNNDYLTPDNKKELKETEDYIHELFLYCNSKMNESFSNYDVLPKLQEKIYVDRTLI